MRLITRHGETLSRLCISVKVLGVDEMLDLGHPWRRNASSMDHLPVDAAEPLVGFDLISAILKENRINLVLWTYLGVAEPCRRISA